MKQVCKNEACDLYDLGQEMTVRKKSDDSLIVTVKQDKCPACGECLIEESDEYFN